MLYIALCIRCVYGFFHFSIMAGKEILKELPGPSGLPVLGSLASLGSFKEKVLMKWAEENYGEVYRLSLGATPTVAIQGYEAVHEAMVEKASTFSDRLPVQVLTNARDNKGLFFKQYDEIWNKWRCFARDGLRDVWQTAEHGIVIEANQLKDALSKLDGDNDISQLILMAMGNAVLQTCFSRRFDFSDKELEHLITMTYKSLRDPKFKFALFLPWLGCIDLFRSYLDEVTEQRQHVVKTLLKLVDERNDDCSESPDMSTFFFKVFPQATEDDRESFAILLEDFIFAGSSTAADAFQWMVLFLVKNPETKKRLQTELDTVLHDCESPVQEAITTKFEEINYARAVLEESFRVRPIAPTSLFHYTTEETSLRGYRIPKDMMVLPNIWSVHHDKEFWAPDPEAFRPERHLDQSGCFKESGHVIPFGIGWRDCLGQRIARTELIAHLVTMFFHFDVSIAASDAEVDMNGVSTALLSPLPYKITLQSRK